MDFEAFDRYAHELYDEIPAEYRAGVAGLRVLRDTHVHPSLPDVFTMGECVTEAFPSSFDGPETVQSFILLYHGSFRELAKRDERFDWEEQIWETVVHELQHHLESLARQDDLEGVDYAMDEEFKRAHGESFDPWYFQRGIDLGEGAYEVEGRYFLELEWDPEDPPADVEFEWDEGLYRVPFPDQPGDVHFLEIHKLPDDPAVDIVLVKRRDLRTRLRGLLARRKLDVRETKVDATEATE